MSRYGYDYSLVTGRPQGWRSLFRNVLMVGTIVAISVVSGGVVALDLFGSGASVADRPAQVTAQPQPVSVRVARAVAPAQPAASAPTNAVTASEKPQITAATAIAASVQPPAPPSATVALQVAPPQKPAPAVSPETAEAPKTAPETAKVAESELTFTTGYARRRAVQTAATTGAGTRTQVARVEEQNQIGRGAKARPKTTVAHQTADQRRVADAVALGDPRASRRGPPPQQQGGLASSNPFGGFFRGLF
jgi:hypothetical protein